MNKYQTIYEAVDEIYDMVSCLEPNNFRFIELNIKNLKEIFECLNHNQCEEYLPSENESEQIMEITNIVEEASKIYPELNNIVNKFESLQFIHNEAANLNDKIMYLIELEQNISNKISNNNELLDSVTESFNDNNAVIKKNI